MTFDPGLLDDLEAAVTEKWIGIAWRVVIGETPPLRSNQRGALWNPAGREALYCSLDETTAIKELEFVSAGIRVY